MSPDTAPANHNSELLYRLDEKMSEILRRMSVQDAAIASIVTQTTSKYESLDTRLRGLENFRWWFVGVAAATGITFGVIKEWVMKGIK
jgi:hypothetical protein